MVYFTAMIIDSFDMQFVIGFLIKDDHVLLVKRVKEPWMNRWNGIGGKIKPGETPTQALIRETEEETEIILTNDQVKYAGIVTWQSEKKEVYTKGMFAFIGYLSQEQQLWQQERLTREGFLAGKSIDWTVDKNNNEVAGNIPYFLPTMLKLNGIKPLRFHCILEENKLKSVKKLNIPHSFNLPEL